MASSATAFLLHFRSTQLGKHAFRLDLAKHSQDSQIRRSDLVLPISQYLFEVQLLYEYERLLTEWRELRLLILEFL